MLYSLSFDELIKFVDCLTKTDAILHSRSIFKALVGRAAF